MPSGIWQSTGRLHPLLLHLPIGFYLFAAFLLIFMGDKKSHRKISKLLLHLTAFLIVSTALTGLLLAREGGYDEPILNRHLILGTITSVIVLLLSQFSAAFIKHAYFKIYVGIGLILLILTGHFGATLTHGNNYLLEPLQDKTEIPTDSTIFAMAVQPVLNAKCGSCHNPSKKKGELVLTTQAGILQGGEHGTAIKPGSIDSSALVTRTLLPLEDDDHMPPAGKAQLTDQETKLLQVWIAAGCSFDQSIAVTSTDSLQRISQAIMLQYTRKNPGTQYRFNFVDSDLIKELNTPFRTVQQISTSEPALKADFFLAQYFEPSSVSELNAVAENIIDLNLAGMPIGDEVINDILKFSNLERLNLNNTKITDKSLERLNKLDQLKTLKIIGTSVTQTGLTSLAKSQSIKEVYLWNTKLITSELSALQKSNPKIKWNTGSEASNELLKLTPPILVNDSFLIENSKAVTFKHNLPGTIIRYTVDGTEPDSINGTIYKTPVLINNHTLVKAIAVKDGWRKSNAVAYQFFVKGVQPKAHKLLTAASPEYKANGSTTFINNILGDPENFRDGNWIAFRHNSMTASFTFDELIKEFTIVYLQNIGSYIMPPEQIEVYTGDDEQHLTLSKKVSPDQPKSYLPNGLGSVTVTLEKPSKSIKMTVKPVAKMPAWHGGKGDKGWVMVSEIIFR